MKIVYARCAGLDVHQRSVSACVRHGKGDQAQSETALFGTFTEQLQELRAWLRRHRVHRVVMESTGVYWMSVWNVLERCPGWKFDLLLINPHQAKALPGRKTDRIDCQRLAELGQHDLLRGSFIPPWRSGSCAI